MSAVDAALREAVIGIARQAGAAIMQVYADGFDVEHKDDLVFLDIRTAREANVFPMVAAGKGLSEMVLAGENL